MRDDHAEVLDLLPLPTASLYILTVLGDGPMHGYGLMTEIRELSGGTVRLGPGTLYGTIKRLLAQGLLVESDERPDADLDDERRRYYERTELGTKVADAEHARLADLLAVGTSRMTRIRPAT